MRLFQDWTERISLAEQGVLACAVRGPDGCGREASAKPLVRALRKAFMNNAHDPGAKADDSFMGDFSGLPVPRDAADAFFADHDAYPHHWIMHFVHAAQIVGVEHPDEQLARYWWSFYMRACDVMHMRPEMSGDMRARLEEKRAWNAKVDAALRGK